MADLKPFVARFFTVRRAWFPMLHHMMRKSWAYWVDKHHYMWVMHVRKTYSVKDSFGNTFSKVKNTFHFEKTRICMANPF